MNWHHLLVWLVCLSSLSFFIRTLLAPHSRGWSFVSGAILGITGGLYLVSPQWAGIVGGLLWAIFLLLPLMGFAQVNKLIYQDRFRDARRWATLLRWLHPADGWFEQPMILSALEMGQQGQMTQAIRSLRPYETTSIPLGRNATALLFLMGARWAELLHWIQTHVPETVLVKDPHLILYYLRALGEVGDLNGMLWGLERYERTLEKGGNPIPLNLVRMFALAFCGQPQEVERLLNGPLAAYSPRVKVFWRITAEMAAQSNPKARHKLVRLQHQINDNVLQSAIAWRLNHPPANPRTTLTDLAWQMLDRLKSEIHQEVCYGNPVTFVPSRASITYSLIGLNVLVFLVEVILGGSQDLDTLNQLGALVPYAVVKGERWRLLAANFLHYGYLHLFANMIGLYLLGPFVESRLGRGRYLFIYLGSGIGAMFLFSAIAIAQNDPYQSLVGASAAIMGVLGAIVAIFLQGWLKDNSPIAARRLRLFLVIIGLQITFDLIIPEVSVLAHVLGLGLGFTLTMLLAQKMGKG
ncbi:rhomboid family intramembrane serine protease [Spirulina sp. CS-785/01]|uniref:rhomboid family intramembrane serine protease n=1 Tax=Spirulina sp. CS-785/01 TaxID=3021716 RepID=UPI00232F09D4|nr:rhomboid family intramembrane serine protease [Spirulina sp. CS-785/01]MDB9312144.1 rhomboid family intramembrane serine protease [Spirulina sp. CS-785/01]